MLTSEIKLLGPGFGYPIGDSSVSGTTVAFLLAGVTVLGVIAYASRSQGRKDHSMHSFARKVMKLSGLGRARRRRR